MARTLGDLSLSSEFKALRESIPAGSRQLLHPAQHVTMDAVRSPKEALSKVVVQLAGIAKALPPGDLVPDHPIVGALSVALRHPEATRDGLRAIPEPPRKQVEEAIARRELPWSADALEWMLVQYVAMVGERVPLDPRGTLAQQNFELKPLNKAWNALLDLEVLRAWGLIT